MPDEVISQIFSRLIFNNLISFSLTNNRLHQISMNLPWNKWIKQSFPDSYKENISNPFAVYKNLHLRKEVMKNRMRSLSFEQRRLHSHSSQGTKYFEQGKLFDWDQGCTKIFDIGKEPLENSINFSVPSKPVYIALYRDKLYAHDDQGEDYIYAHDEKGEDYIPNCTIKVTSLNKENTSISENEIPLLKIPNAFARICECCTHGNLLIVAYEGGRELPTEFTSDGLVDRDNANIDDKAISIWDMNTDKLLQTINLNENDQVRQLNMQKENAGDVCRLAAVNNILFSGHVSGDVLAWSLSDFKYLGKFERCDRASLPSYIGSNQVVMCSYGDKLIYSSGEGFITVCEIDQPFNIEANRFSYSWDARKLSCNVRTKLSFDGCTQEAVDLLIHEQLFASDGLLAIYMASHIVLMDLETGEELATIPHSIDEYCLGMHRGKLITFANDGMVDVVDTNVVDFLFPHHELKLLDAVKEAKTNAELTKIYTELLMLVFCKDRNKMIEYADKLLAVDSTNSQFCECLCKATSGLGSLMYKLYEGVPFDHKVCLQSASFDQIEKALFYFTKWLKTTQKIEVDGPVKLMDPETRAAITQDKQVRQEELRSKYESQKRLLAKQHAKQHQKLFGLKSDRTD